MMLEVVNGARVQITENINIKVALDDGLEETHLLVPNGTPCEAVGVEFGGSEAQLRLAAEDPSKFAVHEVDRDGQRCLLTTGANVLFLRVLVDYVTVPAIGGLPAKVIPLRHRVSQPSAGAKRPGSASPSTVTPGHTWGL
jgi:hypothetical protein